MVAPPITLVDVDGVPAYTSEIGVPFLGTLIFGVGLRDETAPTAGIAHLLEHLVMARVGKVAIPHNARTDDESISFFAQGSPAAVADFLRRVADAVSSISEVTDADVAEQQRIIAAELGADDERPGRGPLLDRFGASTLGLLDVGTPGHRSLTRAQVIAFADTWLHAGNAALAFRGPIPAELAVALPPARPIPARVTPAVIREGAWVVNGTIPLCVSLVLSDLGSLAAMLAAGSILSEALLEDLRTRQQLIYSVNPFVGVLDRRSRFVSYALDPRPSDAVQSAAAALAVLRRLAAEGPTDEELREEIDRWDQSIDDPEVQSASLEGMAISMLRGRRDRDDLSVEDASSLTAADLRAVFADALSTVFVTLGENTPPMDDDQVNEKLGLPFVEITPPLYSTLSKTDLFKRLMRPGVETFNPRMFRGQKGAQIVIDHDRITWLSSQGMMEIPFDQVALASYSDAHRFWSVLGAGGDMLVMELDQWRGDAKAHALLVERLPEESQIRVDVTTP